MKGLFLVFHGFSASNGIIKKVIAQVKALNVAGIETSLCNYSVQENGDRCWLVDNKILSNLGSGLIAKIKKRFCYTSIYQHITRNNISFLYVRYDHNASPFLIRFIKQVKLSGAKVVMEIPTYPYDNEYVGFFDKVNLFVDRCFRKRLAQHLDAIVTFSNEKIIFGQRTIRISNGIDFSTISLKKESGNENEIHLIGVAEIHYWHGFDRVITGLIEYYKSAPKCNVYFHIVGSFAEKAEEIRVHNLIIDGSIAQYIIFHGSIYGAELEQIFNVSDFAIGSLARHRSGITHIKTLKNREYAARGIPFVYSETDDDFDSMPYILKAKADETPIDIYRIVRFCKEEHYAAEDIRKSIEHLSWEKQMKKVVEQAKLLSHDV